MWWTGLICFRIGTGDTCLFIILRPLIFQQDWKELPQIGVFINHEVPHYVLL
jgi:hypothetical protein